MHHLSPELILRPTFQQGEDLIVPTAEMLALPEKVLQFGTGGFLRAFADYFIDEANRHGLFNGRVVMVGSTGSNRAALLNAQGGLYTLRIQGIDRGNAVDRFHVVGSVSRALSAQEDWADVLTVARDPGLEVIVSNTTEVGIVYKPGSFPKHQAPATFPEKLTAALYARAEAFSYDPDKGVVVLPCELIDRNGLTLYDIVYRTAKAWKLDTAFLVWLEVAVQFCDTLVDRIVPGVPSAADQKEIEALLQYEDAMITKAEVYRLWAIQAGKDTRKRLTFAGADPGIVLTEDIQPFKERKIHILNGTHTVSAPLSFLCGELTVLSMMQNPLTHAFVRGVIEEEILPVLHVAGGADFAAQVIERFGNPFLRHRLTDITFQSTTKIRLRVLPVLLRFFRKNRALPKHICLGFAAYLVFMRGIEKQKDGVFGEIAGKPYLIRDDQAGYYQALWAATDAGDEASVRRLVQSACAKEDFWGRNLGEIEGFVECVAGFVWQILAQGAERTLGQLKAVE